MRFFLSALISLIFFSCSPVSKGKLTKHFIATEKTFHDHIGFFLYDPTTKKELCNFNGAKYFTPASNTKILTFYSALKIIGDSIPALRYVVNNDSLIFWGTGDPSFLYKNTFNNARIYEFLNNGNYNLYHSNSNFQTEHFGRGWAWDDYNDYYSPERSSLPVYGNILSVYENPRGITVQPKHFKTSLKLGQPIEKSKITRTINSNEILYSPGTKIKNKVWDIPFKVDPILITTLLTDTLKKPVTLIEKKIPPGTLSIFSVPSDSLYKVMMQESDNFIAEQLLLVCAGILSDTLRPEIAITYMKKYFLNDVSHEPVWVDGSGLSRYNLFTPQSIVQVWEKIYNLVPQERLFKLLAINGKTGTLKNFYKSDAPYIFGKTGTLSNNHNLSGYLITKSGRVLIFAFMNNNYVCPTNEIRKKMEVVLSRIREYY